MSGGTIIFNEGPCLEILDEKKYEAFLSISEVRFPHRYEVRLRSSAVKNCHLNDVSFKLRDATVVESALCAGHHEDKEVWSFSEGFQEERVIEVYGATLRNLRLAYQKDPSDLEINPKQFYSAILCDQHQQANERKEHFRTFPRQELAFNYFDELANIGLSIDNPPSQLKVFSFESTRTGQRKFLVADYDSFFQRYTETNEPNSSKLVSSMTKTNNSGGDFCGKEIVHKHVYEIIRDNVPCRAYFDLEYQKEFNLNIDGDALTAVWINLVVWKVFDLYGIMLGKRDIVVLDSSTTKKYSKHVILIIPKPATAGKRSFDDIENFDDKNPSILRAGIGEFLFRNNIAVGNLVSMIIADITQFSGVCHHSDDGEVRNSVTKQHRSEGSKNDVRSFDGIGDREVDESQTSNGDYIGDVDVGNSNSNCSSGSIIRNELDLLWVNKENGEKTCFVDLGVYTKNRAFRLWNSSKFGKNVPFTVLLQDKRVYQGLSYSIIAKDMEKFDNSATKTQSRKMNPIDQLRDFTLKRSFVVPLDVYDVMAVNDWSQRADTGNNDNSRAFHADVREHGPFLLMTTPPSPVPTIPSSFGHNLLSGACQQEPSAIPLASIKSLQRHDGSMKYAQYLHVPSITRSIRLRRAADGTDGLIGAYRIHSKWSVNEIARSSSYREVSPFPLVDGFVKRFVSKGGVQGILGSWSIYTVPGPGYRIRYSVVHNKWCENIGRAHKSNGIAVEVDLTFLVLTQVCFDSECRGFRSEPVHLPLECCSVQSSHLMRTQTASLESMVPQATDLISNVSERSESVVTVLLPSGPVGATNTYRTDSDGRVSLHQRCDEIKEALIASTT